MKQDQLVGSIVGVELATEATRLRRAVAG